MRIGDEVRVSTPVSTASCIAKPLIWLLERRQRFADRVDRVVGQAASRCEVARRTPGLYDGSTLPNARARRWPAQEVADELARRVVVAAAELEGARLPDALERDAGERAPCAVAAVRG